MHRSEGIRRTEKKRAVVKDGREAVTHWQVIARYGDMTFLRVKLETGRTHQIRVHMAYIKHPIAGDPLYGDPAADRRMAFPPRRMLLHAVTLAFPHPVTGKMVEYSAPPPDDIVYAR